ncbi:50S ribosomal protein L25, partial [Candidatus Collierbacteria bacterium]|nr:50S ribosomal protein L25 [Candidatus Collierbacteria bacterium]
MAKLTLKLDKRTITGKKVKKLRRQGMVPANIFGKDIKSLAVSAKLTDFQKVYQDAGETQIVTLEVKGDEKERPTLITNVQHNPITNEVLHVDFRQVDLKEKITANIPVELV